MNNLISYNLKHLKIIGLGKNIAIQCRNLTDNTLTK